MIQKFAQTFSYGHAIFLQTFASALGIRLWANLARVMAFLLKKVQFQRMRSEFLFLLLICSAVLILNSGQ